MSELKATSPASSTVPATTAVPSPSGGIVSNVQAAQRSEYFVTRWAFLRALGIVYLIAFVSVWVQADGLFGQQGILPLSEFLERERAFNPSQFLTEHPTLFWLNSSDTAIHLVCALGTLASAMLIAGLLPAPSAMAAWLLYLSLVHAGQDFFFFQWDQLLLEAGFLAIFFAPAKAVLTLARDDEPSQIMLWLLRWLCFRLMFSSGLVKLTSGDKTWRDFTAMSYHYFTQPLPTWTAWWMHQLPGWFQKFTTVFVLAIELVVPFFIFAPGRIRRWCAYVLAGFQVLLIATGNYCFFNLLTLVLCIPLLDDRAFAARWRNALPPLPPLPEPEATLQPRKRRPAFRTVMHAALACVLVPLTLIVTLERTYLLKEKSMIDNFPRLQAICRTGLCFGCAGKYGLFQNMTTRRPEIVFEGSNDGENWLEYEFTCKPGDLRRRPVFMAPYQPRLDWQMWFAAGEIYYEQQAPDWFLPFVKRLLEGSPPVLSLLKKNPFPAAPPKYLRAVLYLYTFTDRAGNDGAWWSRKRLGLCMDKLTLDEIIKGPEPEPEPEPEQPGPWRRPPHPEPEPQPQPGVDAGQ